MAHRRRGGLGVRALAVAALGSVSLAAVLAATRASAEVTSGNEEPLLPGPGPGVEPAGAPPVDAAAPQPRAPETGDVSPQPAAPQAEDREPPPGSTTPRSPLEIPSPTAPALDRWPIEYVRRPQTLPAGMLGIAALASAFLPQGRIYTGRTAGGLPFTYHPYVAAGLSLGVGVTDLSEINLTVPRILCFDGGTGPSGCSPYARYNGTGADVEVGLARSPVLQLEIQSGASLGYTSPFVFRWFLATSLRLHVASSVVLRARAAIEQYANPPGNIPNPLIATLTGAADVQVTRRLLLYGHVVPWGSVFDVGEGIELELYGGASLSFTSRAQLSLEAGIYNVLALPAWSHFIPGTFAATDLVFWYD